MIFERALSAEGHFTFEAHKNSFFLFFEFGQSRSWGSLALVAVLVSIIHGLNIVKLLLFMLNYPLNPLFDFFKKILVVLLGVWVTFFWAWINGFNFDVLLARHTILVSVLGVD